MNSYLLASIDWENLTSYINAQYDIDDWVLTGPMLGTHLFDHFTMLNDQGVDPDPTLTAYISPTDEFLYNWVPVLTDHLSTRVVGDNGVVCECPIIIWVDRVYYDHFYRGC